MPFSRKAARLVVAVLIYSRLNALAATDPEIDRLLKKLPEPEKLIHADERVLRVNDPALRDPLIKQIEAAETDKKSKHTLELARQLATRYPSSAVANYYAGYFASSQNRYAEAAASYQRALKIQPRFVVAHFCLAVAEWHQGHFNGALQHVREVTKLEPKAAGGWVARSICAEQVGAYQESVIAARRLVELVPRQPAAWVRLAIAETNVGNNNGGVRAWNQAVALQGSSKQSGTKKTAAKKKSH